ncbi:hypothetical protein GE061_017450 [Apolygus lucorum]|uniref:Uncharacterized protein n=1 Tax=Apolygus lucorum TaxID=248454 RepID=A0A6A4IUZ1_APOLU|nr:hypothetical protein GE061_017450 [Apolygus lucorum]
MPSDPKKVETREKTNGIDLMKIGENDSRFPSPIDLDIRNTKEIEMPSLKWTNAEETPRLMKISNSGHSIIVTAKWFGPYRPYITGCQLPGTYIFSQAHFHWGKNDQEGSEHTTEGKKQPLELHVMYFKTDYGNPERAMKELDGIVVLAYFYNVRKQPNAGLVPIIDALPKVIQPYTSSQTELIPIAKLAPVFSDDFYSYWGNVYAQVNYKILWFIHREAQTISSQQLSLFRTVMGANKEPLLSNFRDPKSINGRTIFLINPGKSRDRTLIEAPPDPEEKENTPPPETKKHSKMKETKNSKRASAAPAGRRKSAKRKSSVRRQSKKAPNKQQKASYDDNERRSNREGHSSRRDDIKLNEASMHHDPRVLMTGVSFSLKGDGLSVSSSSSSSSNTSSSTTTSSSSGCSDINEECSFDIGGLEKRCEFLLKQNKVKEDLPFVDISGLMGKINISAKCDQLLNKLQNCSVNKKETCLPILNDLEKYIEATIEKVQNEKAEAAKKREGLNEPEDISAIGEGTGFFNNGVKLLMPPSSTQDELTAAKPQLGKELKTFKDFVGVNETVSIENSLNHPIQSILHPPPITRLQRILNVESHTIEMQKCQEKQMAEIYSNPPAETRELFRVVINVEEENSCTSLQQASQLPVSQGLAELRRSRIPSDSNVAQPDSLQVREINNINKKVWNFPELASSYYSVAGLLQQVTHSPGVKFISNETMAVVTSQSSTDDNPSAEPSITQNVSYLASQNTIMEIDPSSRSSSGLHCTSGKFIGRKVDKLRRRRSSVKHFNVMAGSSVDKGLKRQTIITKIFQNSVANPRISRTPNVNSLTNTPSARSRQEVQSPEARVKRPSKKPVWKY